ncbi:hypothetical protein HHK36_006808 [Tetracentron sinense]|uniref:Uncharacterized protein n=1 Tax=Tetracentron sinense TaxID=13715 RepID=A0A835DKP6_TETSI|nr:hypothetical protein HHK36_006808 [Tetracentron sinense]
MKLTPTPTTSDLLLRPSAAVSCLSLSLSLSRFEERKLTPANLEFSYPPLAFFGLLLQLSPLRCKVVGPTLGFVAFVVAAIVEWPVGALVYIFRHMKARRIMAHPVTVVYPKVSNAFPI